MKRNVSISICFLALLFCFFGLSVQGHPVLDAIARHHSGLTAQIPAASADTESEECTVERDGGDSAGESALRLQRHFRSHPAGSRMQNRQAVCRKSGMHSRLHRNRSARRHLQNGRHLMVCSLRL